MFFGDFYCWGAVETIGLMEGWGCPGLLHDSPLEHIYGYLQLGSTFGAGFSRAFSQPADGRGGAAV